ncbi:MAG: hypothetical protein MJ160_06000 [Treponema sp.]|nr:hypothetical protein [Treponema sp.]
MATGISRLFNEDSNAISSSRILNYSLEIEGEEIDFQFTDCFQLLLCSLWDFHYKSLLPTDFFYCPSIPEELKDYMKLNNVCLAFSYNSFKPIIYFYEEGEIPFAAYPQDKMKDMKTDRTAASRIIAEKAIPFTEKLNQYISLFTEGGIKPVSSIYKNTNLGGEGGLSRQQFSKLRNKEHISKRYVLLFAIGMRLTVEQTEDLLISGGYSKFKDDDPYDSTIKEFIRKRCFDITEIDNALYNKAGKYLFYPYQECYISGIAL